MVFLTLATAALLASASARAGTPQPIQKLINVSLTDNSPLLAYRPPPGDPDLDNFKYNASLWNATWSEAPWSAWQQNAFGKGLSAHETNTVGNQVSITWIGTGIYFLGTCDNCKVGLTINGADEQEFSPSSGGNALLAVHTDPGASENIETTATLVLKAGRIGLSQVLLSSFIQTYADDATATTQITLNSTITPPLNVNPEVESRQGDGRVWSARQDLGADNDQITYLRLDTNSAQGYALFSIPPKSTMVTLYGTMNHDHGNYRVSLDPPPKTKSGAGSFTFDGFSAWIIPDALLFMAPLDPSVNYTLRLQNLEEGLYFDFHNAKFYTLNLDDSKGYVASHKGGLSPGAIAGIVIGCVLGVLLLIGLLAAFILWKKQQTRNKYRAPGEYNNGNERFEIDPTLETTQYTLTPSTSMTNTGDPSTVGYSQSHLTPLSDESTLPTHLSSDFKPLMSPMSTPTGLAAVPLSPLRTQHDYGFASRSGDLSTTLGSTTPGLGTNTFVTRRSEDREPNVDYVTDTDAGPVRQQVLMPPSYNPEWATQTGPPGRRHRQRSPRLNPIVKAAKGVI